MPHVLVAGKIHEAGLALLKRTPSFTFDYVEEVSKASYAPLVERAEGIVIRTQPLDAAIVAAATRLRIVSRHGVGYDAVDVAALAARGIPLTIVGDVNSRSVAEHTLMLMLTLAKRTLTHDRVLRSGDWGYRNRFDAGELAGKQLLLLGFGRIGRTVATLAQAFGMGVLAYDPNVPGTVIARAGATPVNDLPQAYAMADFVSVHMPLAGSRAVIGEVELAYLKPSVVLINTARGGLIDENALVAGLKSGRIAGAGIDVFATEPPPTDHPLYVSDRVVLTPHTAGLTQESAMRMALSSVQNVLDFFAGRLDPALVVNRQGLPETVLAKLRAV